MNSNPKQLRWWGVLLFASLALNVFLGGIVAGRVTGNLAMPLAIKHRFDTMIAVLPADQQQAVRREMRGALREARPQLMAMRVARISSFEHMAAPTLDLTALQNDFDQLRQHTDAIQKILQQHLIQTLQTLPLEQRSKLAASMRGQLPMGRLGEGMR